MLRLFECTHRGGVSGAFPHVFLDKQRSRFVTAPGFGDVAALLLELAVASGRGQSILRKTSGKNSEMNTEKETKREYEETNHVFADLCTCGVLHLTCLSEAQFAQRLRNVHSSARERHNVTRERTLETNPQCAPPMHSYHESGAFFPASC